MLEHRALDSDFYLLQTGKTFLSPMAALSHYLDVGEASGLAPHPFFEPEWFAAFVGGRRRPELGLLSFWVSDQQASTAPHFDGTRYVAEQCGGEDPDEGAFAHFLRRARTDDLAPASPGVGARTRHDVYATALSTASSLDDETRTVNRRLSPPRVINDEVVASTAAAAVVIDVRSLHPHDALTPVLQQTHPYLRVLIVAPADFFDVVLSREQLDALADDPRAELVWSQEAEPFGAAVSRIVTDLPFVAYWSPGQKWAPGFLAHAISVLDQDPSATAVTARRKAPWLTHDSPLWSRLDLAAGVVVRHRAVQGGAASPELDGGVEWDLLMRIDRSQVRGIPHRLMRMVGASRKPYDMQNPRRSTNTVRARHATATLATGSARVDGRVSVLIPTFEDWSMTFRAVSSALQASNLADLEIIVLDNGSRPAVSRILQAAFAHELRVIVRRVPLNTDFALGSNLALAASSGQYVIFLNNDTVAQPGAFKGLIAALDSGAAAAQALLIYPTGTVQTAGTVFLGRVVPPVHLLANFPVEDVHPALAEVEFHALTAACLAMRASDVLELNGFDPLFVNGMEDVDLCLRLAELDRGPLRLVPEAIVVHHESQTPGRMDRAHRNRVDFAHRWRKLLATNLDDRHVLDATHLRISGTRSTRLPAMAIRRSEIQISRPERVVAHGPAAGLPSLRWAIKTAVPGVEHDHRWGDLFFARDLAAGLTRLGQEVVIDRRPAGVRPESDHLDDVAVSLRGLAEFQPQPDCINLMWVISHPDLVTAAELQNGWDRVYAAGPAWAEQATKNSGTAVHPLLQATNSARFHPDAADDTTPVHDVLFVGNTRRIFRPIVRDAVAVAADLAVYGNGWDEYIDSALIRSDRLANEDLPGAYAASRIVLNDHWADMSVHGFLSNRLFDAAASGARVITDPVSGIDDVFGPNVRVYRGLEELRSMIAPEGVGWPSDDERRSLATAVADLHSFDARALTLLRDVFALRGIEHSWP